MSDFGQPMTSDREFIPVYEWTNDEWVWVLATFPPNTDSREAEKAIADRRREAATDDE